MKARKTEYLFVDGGYLRGVLRGFSTQLYAGESVAIDPVALTRDFRKTFYYDCLPEQKVGEPEETFRTRQLESEQSLAALRAAPGVHVITGSTSAGKRQRQKQVDVAIAVDMLSHAHRRNMSEATLLSGDLDFKPVVDALVRDGMWVTVWCELASASQELILSADARRDLGIRASFDFLDRQLLQKFPRPDEHGRNRQGQPELDAVRRGYSERLNSDAFLVETAQRWEVVLRSRDESRQEGCIGHPDRGFVERYTTMDRGVLWQ